MSLHKKMKIQLIQIGKTTDSYLLKGIREFERRLSFYSKFESIDLELKGKKRSTDLKQQKLDEGKLFLSKIPENANLILLDEKGKEYTSENFSVFLQKQLNAATDICFCIGGPYGFDESVYARANHKIALSKMTLTHQMVRLFFTEQLYRAFTILKGEKYHH